MIMRHMPVNMVLVLSWLQEFQIQGPHDRMLLHMYPPAWVLVLLQGSGLVVFAIVVIIPKIVKTWKLI